MYSRISTTGGHWASSHSPGTGRLCTSDSQTVGRTMSPFLAPSRGPLGKDLHELSIPAADCRHRLRVHRAVGRSDPDGDPRHRRLRVAGEHQHRQHGGRGHRSRTPLPTAIPTGTASVPTRELNTQMHRWEAQAKRHGRPQSKTLSYGGGVDGIGVTSGGAAKVYLVFYGSQWGTQGTDARRQRHLHRRSQGRRATGAEALQGPGHRRRGLVGRHDAVLRRSARGQGRDVVLGLGAPTCATRPAAPSPASGTTTRPPPRPTRRRSSSATRP